MKKFTIGFPRMIKEEGEKRVFLPDFIRFLTELGANVYLEKGYGSRSGHRFFDYQKGSQSIFQCSRAEVFKKDFVIVLRCPELQELNLLGDDSCLISMLHYSTRPERIEYFRSHGIKTISLDEIANDDGIRLVENMRAVAWNGLATGFEALETRWHGLKRPDGGPTRVLILGTGMVGKHAMDAATKLGNTKRNELHIAERGAGVVVTCVGRNITYQSEKMQRLLQNTDILVDATQRRNFSVPVAPNEWIGWLPDHSVIVDLSVDPYTLHSDPAVVRGLEGIPQGNLDQVLFQPDDENWDKSVPESIPSDHRRAVASCYSWPGIHPESCMNHYARQLKPLMRVLLERGYGGLSNEGTFFERALQRAKLETWMKSHKQRLDSQPEVQ